MREIAVSSVTSHRRFVTPRWSLAVSGGEFFTWASRIAMTSWSGSGYRPKTGEMLNPVAW